jgi:hypothetical protein
MTSQSPIPPTGRSPFVPLSEAEIQGSRISAPAQL